MLVESWDEDPEARLTAANIVSRLEDLRDTKLRLDNESVLTTQTDPRLHAISPSDNGSRVHLHTKLHASSSYSGQSSMQGQLQHPRLAARRSMGNAECSQSSQTDCVSFWQQQRVSPRLHTVDAATGQPEGSPSSNNNQHIEERTGEQHGVISLNPRTEEGSVTQANGIAVNLTGSSDSNRNSLDVSGNSNELSDHFSDDDNVEHDCDRTEEGRQ